MQFLHPQILWALLALSIPIIIHLFHFRRFKKVYFTNVRFLKEIKEEKSTRRQLRNLLVLLCRLLAFSFLIFAFAQPFISKDKTSKTGKNYVSIFIDNSNSMMALSEDVPLLDKAKKKAEEIVNAYGVSDQFQIISHELSGSQQRWINQENTIQAIEDVALNPEVNQLSIVLNKQKQSKPHSGNHILYYLSDFQESITDFDLSTDTLSEVNLIPMQSVKEGNVSIDSAWFESVVPSINQNNKLLVRVKNYSDEPKENIRLSTIHNNQNRPEGTISIPANGNKVDTINLLITSPGWQNVEIKIDDYPIQFDDRYFISFNIKEKTTVLSINNSNVNRYLNAVFTGLKSFELKNVQASAIRYDEIKDYDLIILDELNSITSGLSSALKSYVENGGNVITFPPANSNIESYNNFFSALNANTITRWNSSPNNVYQINTNEFVFDNVYASISTNLKLPSTQGHYEFNNFSTHGGEFLLKYRNGQNYITKYKRGKGNLFVSAAPLDKKYNDLVINAEVFVPLVYKVSYAANQSDKLAFNIGRDNYTEVKNTSNSNDITYSITGAQEFIPGQTNLGNTTLINFNNMISEAGYYDLTLNSERIKNMAFNYDRIESNLDYLGIEELKSNYGNYANIIGNTLRADLGNVIKEKDQGITYWRLCLILALLFLALETGLLRFLKT